jgi:hypothetical protein
VSSRVRGLRFCQGTQARINSILFNFSDILYLTGVFHIAEVILKENLHVERILRVFRSTRKVQSSIHHHRGANTLSCALTLSGTQYGLNVRERHHTFCENGTICLVRIVLVSFSNRQQLFFCTRLRFHGCCGLQVNQRFCL